METALTTAANTGTAVTLEQITDFEWDKVYVIGPYDQFDYSHISHVPAGEVTDKLLSVRRLHIILCAKSAEDY